MNKQGGTRRHARRSVDPIPWDRNHDHMQKKGMFGSWADRWQIFTSGFWWGSKLDFSNGSSAIYGNRLPVFCWEKRLAKKCFLHLMAKKPARYIFLIAEVQARFRRDKITKIMSQTSICLCKYTKPIQTVSLALDYSETRTSSTKSSSWEPQTLSDAEHFLVQNHCISEPSKFEDVLFLGLVGPFVSPKQTALVFFFGMSELTLQDHEAVTQAHPEITKGKEAQQQPCVLRFKDQYRCFQNCLFKKPWDTRTVLINQMQVSFKSLISHELRFLLWKLNSQIAMSSACSKFLPAVISTISTRF